MSEKKNPFVFLDLSIDGDPVERIVIEVTQCYRILFFASTFAFFLLLELKAFSISEEVR
jgi:hypothetical protein